MVDSHAHLNHPAFAHDLEEVLGRAAAAGVEEIVVAGFDIPSSRRAVSLAEGYAQVLAAVGVCPHEAASLDGAGLSELENVAKESARVVAIGETGLDYYRMLSPGPAQRAAFEAQLDLAGELGLPVVVHCREAWKDVLAIMPPVGPTLAGAVVHCFSGDRGAAEECCARGYLVSVAGNITYQHEGALCEVIGELEEDRLLLETDCPYLAPAPHRGKRCEPAHLSSIVEHVARVRGCSPESLSVVLRDNSQALFKLRREVSKV